MTRKILTLIAALVIATPSFAAEWKRVDRINSRTLFSKIKLTCSYRIVYSRTVTSTPQNVTVTANSYLSFPNVTSLSEPMGKLVVFETPLQGYTATVFGDWLWKRNMDTSSPISVMLIIYQNPSNRAESKYQLSFEGFDHQGKSLTLTDKSDELAEFRNIGLDVSC